MTPDPRQGERGGLKRIGRHTGQNGEDLCVVSWATHDDHDCDHVCRLPLGHGGSIHRCCGGTGGERAEEASP